MKTSKITTINIINRQENIFSGDKYIIPLYQRAFAWGAKEIEQMIDDILNFDTENYYLGNLIVFLRKDNKFEVIDGQQRLTALYLLLRKLEIDFPGDAVSFEHRKKSDYTLLNLHKNDQNVLSQDINDGILSGFVITSKKLIGKIEKIKKKLSKVKLVRVIVPPNTDLNKYFEIMNNRGEQLEQQDIVKSHLVEMILHKEKRDAFSRIWDACSNMDGYVQMHFGPSERKHYFGLGWNKCPEKSHEYYLNMDESDLIQKRSINEIAESASAIGRNISVNLTANEDNMRFESFLEFRHLLLHVLKIFELQNSEDGFLSQKDWGGDLLHDKKLIKRFEDVFNRYDNSSIAAEQFGLCLLKCRFLLDMFMLKREFSGDDTEGKWSLKVLKVSWSNSRKYGRYQPSAYYVDVPGADESRMLQSMFRVTYTSPLVMHWATEYLAWLYFNGNDYASVEAVKKLNSIARTNVKKYMDNSDYNTGLITPHIVFNYLDYLLWNEAKNDFQFEFRNSIEHWYPQNPIDTNMKWHESKLNHFGNLCLVSSNLNSKFSNNLPLAKKANFRSGIESQSLKLQEMARVTEDTIHGMKKQL